MTVKPLSALLALCLLGGASLVHAQTVLLSENFNAENGGTGAAVYSGFANFTAADVDLLAPGFFFDLCERAGGSTPCIDMEGNGNGSLTTKTEYSLPAGTVGLQFDLAGDQRTGTGSNVTVSLVNNFGQTLYSETFELSSATDFTTFSRSVSLSSAQTARLRFVSGGPADSYGMLLDNVVLTAGVAAAVPEPSTYAMLGTGLATLLWLRRRSLNRPGNPRDPLA